ncbi:MAG: polysaccharide biosynthesis/export family protein [Planctomycetia bacterium]|nr:polysaccharide biosynthesis/export family protein [Planctomycetia bacterium]
MALRFRRIETTAHTTQYRPQGRVVIYWLAILLFFNLFGCHHSAYKSRSLPPQLAAPAVIDVQRIDLSWMGGPTSQNEVIFPGDTVQVTTVTGGEDDRPQPWDLHVGDNGAVDVPLVGLVQIAGLNPLEAEGAIRAASVQRRVFRKPSVRVAIGQRRVNRVAVIGAVAKPDTYELSAANSSLANALAAAGGLSKNADRFIEVHQPAARTTAPVRMANRDNATATFASSRLDTSADVMTVQIDLLEAVIRSDGAYYLRDGSTVNVKSRPDRFVHLIGLTGNRTLELPPNRNVHVLDALAQAGGPKYSNWIADKVKVIRHVPGSDETATINVSIREAKRDGVANILLAPEDIVSVEENVMTFTLGTLGQLVGIGASAATGATRFVP